MDTSWVSHFKYVHRQRMLCMSKIEYMVSLHFIYAIFCIKGMLWFTYGDMLRIYCENWQWCDKKLVILDNIVRIWLMRYGGSDNTDQDKCWLLRFYFDKHVFITIISTSPEGYCPFHVQDKERVGRKNVAKKINSVFLPHRYCVNCWVIQACSVFI